MHFKTEKLQRAFFKQYKSLNLTQSMALDFFYEGGHILITSPTGSGKTLAAFLGIIDDILLTNTTDLIAVYLCPLKALINDLTKNLESFISNIEGHSITVKSRTGDTKLQDRKRDFMSANIFCTTPESFSLALLNEEYLERLKSVKYVLIDEAHALAESKRGTETAIIIARLRRLNPDIKIIALSATIDPIRDIGYLLFGNEKFNTVHANERSKPTLVCRVPKQYSYEDLEYSNALMSLEIAKIVSKEPCTLIFVNTRSAAEALSHRLMRLLPNLNVSTHHSSMSRESRMEVESGLKRNDIQVVVSSCSLEQGIDIPTITKVIQCFSPRQINRATQRIGRAGHGFYSATDAVFFALTRCEAVEISVILKSISLGKLDKINIPTDCLDMLTQAILNLCFTSPLTKREVIDFVHSITVYKKFPVSQINLILSYLLASDRQEKTRRYFARLYLTEDGRYKSYGGVKRVEYMLNVGSIVSDELLQVKTLGDKKLVGFLDENFLLEIKKGDVFLLGGKRYQYRRHTGNTAWASLTQTGVSLTPVWFSETLPISFEVGSDIIGFRAEILDMFFNGEVTKIRRLLLTYHLEDTASWEVFDHFKQQYIWLFQHGATTNLRDKTLVEVVPISDKLFNVIFHTYFGLKINTLLALVMKQILIDDLEVKIDVMSKASNNGVLFTIPKDYIDSFIDNVSAVYKAIYDLSSRELVSKLRVYITKTEFFNRILKKNAYRTLNILKTAVQQTPVPNYVILNSIKKQENVAYQETLREIIYDYLNVKLLNKIISKSIFAEPLIVRSDIHSPFAHGVIFNSTNIDMKLSSEFITNINNSILDQVRREHFVFSDTTARTISFYSNQVIVLDKSTGIKTLVISDPHIGMEYTNRIDAINTSQRQMERISYILNTESGITQIIILGDIKDSYKYQKFSNYNELSDIRSFLSFLKGKFERVILIKGNHDGMLEKSLNLPVESELRSLREDRVVIARKLYYCGILFMHGDQKIEEFRTDADYTLIGHEHPRIDLQRNDIFIKRVPTILQMNRIIVIPSINEFKSGRSVDLIVRDKEKLLGDSAELTAYVFYEGLWTKIRLDRKSNTRGN